jgi:hypothetical protein
MSKSEQRNDYLIVSSKAKIRLAPGLFWQTIPSDASIKSELSKLSDELTSSHYALHNDGVVQLGFTSLPDNDKWTTYSLALAVSSLIEDRTFICVVDLGNDVFCYIAQREGALIPTGDVSGDREFIQEKLNDDLSIMTGSQIYAPEDWGVSSFGEITLHDLLSVKLNSAWKVKRVKSEYKKIIVRGLIVVAIAAFLLTGLYIYKEREEKRLAEAEMQRAALLAQQSADSRPWIRNPDPSVLTNICIKEIQSFPLHPGGWTPGAFTCDGVTSTAEWNIRDYLTIAGLQADIEGATFDEVGKKAIVKHPVNFKFELGSDANITLLELHDRRSNMLSIMQSIGHDIVFQQKAAPPPVILPDGTSAPPLGWINLTWHFTTSFSPMMIINELNDTGFKVTSLTRAVQDGAVIWTVKGDQYVY